MITFQLFIYIDDLLSIGVIGVGITFNVIVYFSFLEKLFVTNILFFIMLVCLSHQLTY